ncbi:cell division protein ZipA [Pseudoalteromonas sp. SWXJZ94C]|uniref:cell division protein ZipA n=1 Tax=unclassified Pseudoalteromonas TaxID=194690 RepID=UPI0004194404|nr:MULTISPECIES: cell division protein ZipA [unclassified Pseudoalteromonas]MBH0058469.1 cell division protein ZipA [Pseudoalteromonas sp. SWXJZ94C]
MAEQLRWVLIIISVVVIGGLLIHGLWSVRKKDRPEVSNDERVEPSQESAPIKSHSPRVKAEVKEPEINQRDEPQFGELNFDTNEPQIEIDVPETPIEDDLTIVDEPAEVVEQSDGEKPAAMSDFVIVHIQMPDGLSMQGSKLLPAVNTLGFKYSEEGFFNRHIDPAGQGPVLFRLVNMYNPGTFDIDNMEQFSTAGVSLFMTLPCEGDGLAAFNMLHSAAKKLSDEFGAQILDAERQEMTVDRIRLYVEQVRAFSA